MNVAILFYYKLVDRDVDVFAAMREIVTQDVKFNNRVGSRLGF